MTKAAAYAFASLHVDQLLVFAQPRQGELGRHSVRYHIAEHLKDRFALADGRNLVTDQVVVERTDLVSAQVINTSSGSDQVGHETKDLVTDQVSVLTSSP